MLKEANAYVERFHELEVEANPWRRMWEEIAQYERPQRAELNNLYYGGQQRPADMKLNITDSTAFTAVDNMSGGLYSFLSNEATGWFDMKTFDEDLNRFPTSKAWLARVSRTMRKSYEPSFSPFYDQVSELYADTPAFGTGVMFSEWMVGRRRIFDQVYSILDVYVDTSNYNEVDTIFRPFYFTGRQALQKWGKEALGDKLGTQAEDKPSETIRFIHVVHPNEAFMPGYLGPDGLPFVDVYVALEAKHIVQSDGRHEFPYQVPRWSGKQKYGFGLGIRNLPDVKTINSMDNSLLENAEWINHPSILMANEDALSTVRPVPRRPIFGGLSFQGRRQVDFLQPGGQIPFTFEMLQARREQLKEAWYFSLMSLAGRTGMTATEILERNEDRFRLMGPYLSRMRTEFLSPNVGQRFSTLWRQGQFPPPPPELRDQELKIEYTSPMAKAQEAGEATSTARLVDATIALASVKPEAIDHLNDDNIVEIYQNGFGAPPRALNSPDQVEAIREQRQQIQQAQQAMALAEQGANVGEKVVAIQRGGAQDAA